MSSVFGNAARRERRPGARQGKWVCGVESRTSAGRCHLVGALREMEEKPGCGFATPKKSHRGRAIIDEGVGVQQHQ